MKILVITMIFFWNTNAIFCRISDVYKSVRAAKTAAQSILLASLWMIHLERAVLPITVCGLVAPSNAMAWVTVMRIAVAEPE